MDWDEARSLMRTHGRRRAGRLANGRDGPRLSWIDRAHERFIRAMEVSRNDETRTTTTNNAAGQGIDQDMDRNEQ